VDSLSGTAYFWESKGGIIRSGQGTSKVTIEWTSLSQQSIKVTPTNPCGNGLTLEQLISVTSTPPRPPEISGPNLVGIEESDYFIETVPEVNYQWSAGEGGSIINGQGTGTVRVKWEKEGDFNLTVTPMNACNEGEGRTLPINVNLITGIIEEERKEAEIKIFPSPSSGDIQLVIQSIPDIREINIYNAFGQLLYHTYTEHGVFDFQIRDLPKGIHTVVLKGRTKNHVKMILVR
jgi:hypothetical protein